MHAVALLTYIPIWEVSRHRRSVVRTTAIRTRVLLFRGSGHWTHLIHMTMVRLLVAEEGTRVLRYLSQGTETQCPAESRPLSYYPVRSMASVSSPVRPSLSTSLTIATSGTGTSHEIASHQGEVADLDAVRTTSRYQWYLRSPRRDASVRTYEVRGFMYRRRRAVTDIMACVDMHAVSAFAVRLGY